MQYYKGNLRLIEGIDGDISNDRIVDSNVVVYEGFAHVYCYAISGDVVSRKEDAQSLIYSSLEKTFAIYFDFFHMEPISSLEAAQLVLQNYWGEFSPVLESDISKVLQKVMKA